MWCPARVPFNDATDVDVKPVPVMVVVKMPSGNCPFEPTLVMTGVGGISVTVAVAVPFGPVAVTVSVPRGRHDRRSGIQAGRSDASRKSRPKPVAPAEVNCCVAPRFRETVTGAMVCGFRTCSVTAAEADPPGPVAVTVTELDDGMVEGAVIQAVDADGSGGRGPSWWLPRR